MAIVYLLTNTESGKAYVGKSVMSLDTRWYEHVRAATKGSHGALHAAIRKYGTEAFTREVLAWYATENEALAAEREWIVKLQTMSPRGYNMTEGGLGVGGSVMSGVLKRAWLAPGRRERASITQKAVRSTPEFRAAQSVRSTEIGARPAVRAARADAQREAWADPVKRATRTASIKASRTPNFNAAQSERMSAKFADPAVRERCSAAQVARRASPEDEAARATKKARPCKCGRPRVNGICRTCKSAGELLRRRCREVEALAGYVGERCRA